MVPLWKRLLFSLVSIVGSALICLACVVAESLIKTHPASIRSSEVLMTAGVTLGLCLLAWILSWPVILIIKNVRAWRFWLYFVLGSASGPSLVLAVATVVFIAIPHSPGAPWFNPALLPLVYLAAAISSLASLFYLLLLRRAQNRSAVVP